MEQHLARGKVEVEVTTSSFADRLWWARHRAGLGATRLARLVACSQSLISSLERNNAEKSRLNNAFAKALKVDATWLAHGIADRAPPDFDAAAARKGREGMGDAPPSVVRLPVAPAEPPRWAGEEAEPLAPLTGADAMMKGLVNAFMDFCTAAGVERALRLLDTLRHVAALSQEGARQNQVAGTNERDNRAEQ